MTNEQTKKKPARVKRTGQLQLSVVLRECDAAQLERLRVQGGHRSWGAVVRDLIANSPLNAKAQR